MKCCVVVDWETKDLLQGVPVGLAFGSIPFLLKSKLSYGQVGLFSLASYPYSMKLLWSPIVDAVYSRRMGRRKSWIVPIQACSSILLLYLGSHIEALMEHVSLLNTSFGIDGNIGGRPTLLDYCNLLRSRLFLCNARCGSRWLLR